MSTYCAVLMDVSSIQKYVFHSNQLADNLGASYIVNTLFDEAVQILPSILSLDEQKVESIMASWKNDPENVLMEQNSGIPFEIGIADGGKALILFREKAACMRFIQEFTRHLLIAAPGLQLAVAIKENFDVSPNGFSKHLSQLFEELIYNRNRYHPLTVLPSHGITALHSQNGITITSPTSAMSRERRAAEEWQRLLHEDLKHRHPQYCFTNQIDELGQAEGDNFVAVVHIDGNGIGNWFKQSSSLVDYRKRAQALEQISRESFWQLVDVVVEQMKRIQVMENTPGFVIKSKDDKECLLLRPIIQGGDDLTFVCHGKLALYLAEQYIKIWTKKANNEEQGPVKFGRPADGGFTACAGIAIAKTKYPFYRTYQVAQQCCAEAKKIAREKGMGSWIDFQVVMGTKSGGLADIRKEEYSPDGIDLHYGPYILDSNTQDAKSFASLKQGIREFQLYENWAKRDLNNLRSSFYLGRETIEDFMVYMRAKGGELPKRERWYSRPYSNNETPYFDMLEMMDFYPLWLLGGEQENAAN